MFRTTCSTSWAITSIVDAALRRDEMDVVADITAPFPIAVIAELMGVPRRIGTGSTTGRTG